MTEDDKPEPKPGMTPTEYVNVLLSRIEALEDRVDALEEEK